MSDDNLSFDEEDDTQCHICINITFMLNIPTFVIKDLNFFSIYKSNNIKNIFFISFFN